MNVYHPTIKTFDDIRTWLEDLDEADMLFDVSLPARSVVSLATGQRMWTDVEADLIDAAVRRCVDLCVEDSTKFDDDANVHCGACGAEPGEEDKARIVSAAAAVVADRSGRWEILNSYTDL